MKNGHGGVAIGSEISGGCSNVVVENCNMDSPELERAIRIKTNSLRGGIIENIFFRNLEIGEVKDAVVRIECAYEMKKGEEGKYTPTIRNISFSEISSTKSKFGISIEGLKDQKCVYNISFQNITFNGVKEPNKISFAENVRIRNVKLNGTALEK
jgi:polygalacturonase